MMRNSTVVRLRQPEAIDDPLTAVLRSGARRLLAQAIEAEAEAFLALMKGVQLPDGRDRVARHGHAPERGNHPPRATAGWRSSGGSLLLGRLPVPWQQLVQP
jgi:hypothetical protein